MIFKSRNIVLLLLFLVSIAVGPVEQVAAEDVPLPAGLRPGKPYDGTSITIMVPYGGQFSAVVDRTPRFTELTGIVVNYLFVPYLSLQNKITAECLSATGEYDILCYLDSWGPSLKDCLIPLDDKITATGIDMNRYPSSFQQAVTYHNHIYAMPFRGHPQLLFYRKDIFQQLGLQPPTTWKELEDVARIITEKTGLYGIAMYYAKGTSLQNLFVWFSYLWSNGGDLFDTNWKPIFHSTAGVEATQRYVDLLRKHKVTPPESVSWNEYEGVNSVAQNESAMVIVWWWSYAVLTNPELAEAEVVDNIGFVPAPAWENRGAATYAILMPFGISVHSKHPEAAWEYLKWVSHPELEKEIVLDKRNPKTTTVVTVQLANLQDTEVNALSGGMHEAAAKSLSVSRIIPQIVEWPEVSQVLEVAIHDIASGKPTQKTLDRAAEEIEQIMEQAGYYK